MNKEEKSGDFNRKVISKQHLLEVAAGHRKADLVFRNATYVDVFCNTLACGDIAVQDGIIAGIGEGYEGRTEIDVSGQLVLPGLMDAHIHLESSLVSPTQFVKAVLPHGTTTVVTDPHEIANVMGTDGIDYILQATAGLPLDVRVMIPSCVPATPLDESGASLDYRAVDSFYANERVLGLAEMMNFPGVLSSDKQVLEKIVAARSHGKIVDGHAPGLSGISLNAYVAAGIYSDHECFSAQEALAKMARGQSIMIREGTAARNLDALIPLLKPQYAANCLFCTDDIHPSDLLSRGHIDYIIRRAIQAGVDPIIAVKCATLNPARYFRLFDRGAVAPGYLADLVVIDDFEHFSIVGVYKNGEMVVDRGAVCDISEPEIDFELVDHALNTFHMEYLKAEDIIENRPRAVLGMVPGEIITSDEGYSEHIDAEKDILKIIVAERHNFTHHIGIGYIKGYGLKRGAIATSISHDSHNIIAVGASEAEIAEAVNRIIDLNGGIVVCDGGHVKMELPLHIAGLISVEPLAVVNEKLEAAKAAAFELGVSKGVDPFMTLSFMALPVIPALRLTTRGMFDVVNQRYV
jgi:adenine deaminase